MLRQFRSRRLNEGGAPAPDGGESEPWRSPYLHTVVSDGGVALISTFDGAVPNVMTATFFAESSHFPPLVRVAIAPATLTHRVLRATRRFGISVLTRGQERAALLCGHHSGRDIAKLDLVGLRWYRDAEDVVLLPDAYSTSACRVVEEIELADHTLFVGEIMTSYRQTVQSHRLPMLLSDLRAFAGTGEA